MFARTTKFTLLPGKVTEFKGVYHEHILPALQRQPGFRAAVLLIDEPTNKVLGITQWATEADLIAIQSGELNKELVGSLRPLIVETLVQEAYTVAFQIEPI